MKSAPNALRPLLVRAFAVSLFPTLAFAQHYQQTNLVSNVPVTPAASVTDPNLQNAWGLVHGPSTPWWISNNAGGTSTLYNTSGLNPANTTGQTPAPVLEPVTIVALNAAGGAPGNGVKIPNPPGQPAPGSPTAVLYNGSTTDFLLPRANPQFSSLPPKTARSRAGTRVSMQPLRSLWLTIPRYRRRAMEPFTRAQPSPSLAARNIPWPPTSAAAKSMFSIPTSNR